MKHLIRKKLLDLTWDSAALDAAAEFWLRLYEMAAGEMGFALSPTHTLEIRLRGFPRRQAAAIREELGRRLAARHEGPGTAPVYDFPLAQIDQPDPDTLTITSAEAESHQSPPEGLGLPLLDSLLFDGLFAEIRVRAGAAHHGFVKRTKSHATLVLIGEIRGGNFHLKGAWRTGSAGWEDDLSWAGGWIQQDEWLAALDRFRQTHVVPVKLAKLLFLPSEADWYSNLVVRIIHVPLDRPRTRGLLLRIVVFLLLLTAIGFAAYHLIREEKWIWLFALSIPAWLVCWLSWTFLKGELRLWFVGFREFHGRYSQLYQQTVELLPLAPAEASKQLDHPWAHKYTGDLEAAGFRLLGDLRSQPELNGDCVIRVFLAPDGVCYLNLLFSMSTSPDPEKGFRLWPAAVAFLAHTFFEDGGRATSVNGRTAGYRKKRTGPEHMARVFTDATEPVEFFRLHSAAAEEFARATGRRAVRHERLDLYVRRQNEMQEEERKLFAPSPYSWGDHFRWILQSPRREYRR